MIPKPGSNKARAQGCTCPVLDNLEGGDLLGLYWMDLKCPVHGRERRGEKSGRGEECGLHPGKLWEP